MHVPAPPHVICVPLHDTHGCITLPTDKVSTCRKQQARKCPPCQCQPVLPLKQARASFTCCCSSLTDSAGRVCLAVTYPLLCWHPSHWPRLHGSQPVPVPQAQARRQRISHVSSNPPVPYTLNVSAARACAGAPLLRPAPCARARAGRAAGCCTRWRPPPAARPPTAGCLPLAAGAPCSLTQSLSNDRCCPHGHG